ncbi:Essential protein Yae1 N-terminal domain-containing protein [Plasmodiophora brassicae]|uniref:Essential protein Yae1 N-terminal domain-containing protein n=1 Tax=Plasmodiophora brassicae TaxID=37360 RepID=A0A0G4IRJ5_PLABS|nr:hypothetical protein PBRA_005883 [Plasmodiophora brassicae]SPQ98316.1 unnamed protein product [Plasmodiophora brassicae]
MDDLDAAFDSVLFLEQEFAAAGRSNGIEAGRASAAETAFGKGQALGRALGREIGFYRGFLLGLETGAIFVAVPERARKSIPKLKHAVNLVEQSVRSFDADDFLQGRLRLARAKFRALTKVLEIDNRLEIIEPRQGAPCGSF